MSDVEWLDEPEDHDYDAAESYLSLTMLPLAAKNTARMLKAIGKDVEHPAKDILRASGLPLLSEHDEHVAKDIRKVEDGKKLSPVLLVRGQSARVRPLVIADGYHRVCAAYWIDEDTMVHARIVDA